MIQSIIRKSNRMNAKISLSILCIVIILGIFHSCNKLLFREIECRDFEFHDDLKWFAGNVGDVITLSTNDNETKKFTIEDKYIIHTKKYTSDIGCGCQDIWGIFLSTAHDTIV